MKEIKPKRSPSIFRRRNWSRFSLRFMMIVVTILCVWFGVLINRAARQKAIVRMVSELGGHVIYDYQLQPPNDMAYFLPSFSLMNPGAKSPVSELAISTLGIDFFHKPVAVDFANVKPMSQSDWTFELMFAVPQSHSGYKDSPNQKIEADFENICHALPDLESLVVGHRFVTDKTLEAIAKLPKLKRLEFFYPQELTDEGIACLEGLHHLEVLKIKGATDFSDLALKSFSELKNLEILDVPWGEYTDQGVRFLERLEKLRRLEFPEQGQATAAWHKYGKSPRSIKLTDETLRSLSKLERLELLSIYSDHFTEPGIKFLADIDSLSALKIGGLNKKTPLSWAGVASFENSKNLVFLDLNNTQLLIKDGKKFERRNPLCRVLAAQLDQAEIIRKAMMNAMRKAATEPTPEAMMKLMQNLTSEGRGANLD